MSANFIQQQINKLFVSGSTDRTGEKGGRAIIEAGKDTGIVLHKYLSPSTMGRRRWTWGSSVHPSILGHAKWIGSLPAEFLLDETLGYWKVANISTDPETGFNSLISVLFIRPSSALQYLYIKKKKNPVKVADNRLPLSLHSIDFTPFSLPSNSPFLDWKAIPYAINAIRWTRDECVRIFLIHRNLILVTIIVEGREELSSNRQARLLDDSCMSWRRKLETAYFTGRRIPSEKSREGTARWRVEYRAAFHGGDSAERSSEKSLTRLKQTFPPPPLSIRGREIRRGLPLTCVSMDEW